jgi:hypothetical protein
MNPELKEKIGQIFHDVARGDEHAVHVCWSVYQFLHVIDDLVDRDQALDARTVGLSFLVFTETVAANPFFQANREVLLGALRTGVIEWIDSEAWKNRDDLKCRMAAEVIKSGYQGLFFQVAYLCGGLAHMQAMSEKHREYCWD